MKLASYNFSGKASYGIVDGAEVIDMGEHFGERYPNLRSVIRADAMHELSKFAKNANLLRIPLTSLELLSPIGDPEKILCVGRNYKAHAAEGNNALPKYPMLFIRLINSLAAHGQAMICPKVSHQFDYEGELAVIIGKPGRHIAKGNALQHVAGSSCFNDGSIRDYQFDHGLMTGKNFPSTGGFGPVLVTADEIPDPTKLVLTTRLNGIQLQQSGLDQLVFDIPTLIAYISSFTPLVAGDVICTGTPEGVGFARSPPLWMKPGDLIEVDISGIGVLQNPIEMEA